MWRQRFFTQIDQALRPLLTARQYPLMLAGVKREISLYESINTYDHLLHHHVEGSANWIATADLFELATKAWEKHDLTAEEDLIHEIEDADNRARLVKDLLDLLPAVECGKTHQLILPEHTTGDATDEMINHLAVAALRQKTRISILNRMSLPAGSVAGILRYGREESRSQPRAS